MCCGQLMKALYPRSCYWHYANNANWISIWQLNCFNLIAKIQGQNLYKNVKECTEHVTHICCGRFFFILTISGLFCSPEKTNSLHSQLDRGAWLLHSSHLLKNVKNVNIFVVFHQFFLLLLAKTWFSPQQSPAVWDLQGPPGQHPQLQWPVEILFKHCTCLDGILCHSVKMMLLVKAN